MVVQNEIEVKKLSDKEIYYNKRKDYLKHMQVKSANHIKMTSAMSGIPEDALLQFAQKLPNQVMSFFEPRDQFPSETYLGTTTEKDMAILKATHIEINRGVLKYFIVNLRGAFERDDYPITPTFVIGDPTGENFDLLFEIKDPILWKKLSRKEIPENKETIDKIWGIHKSLRRLFGGFITTSIIMSPFDYVNFNAVYNDVSYSIEEMENLIPKIRGERDKRIKESPEYEFLTKHLPKRIHCSNPIKGKEHRTFLFDKDFSFTSLSHISFNNQEYVNFISIDIDNPNTDVEKLKKKGLTPTVLVKNRNNNKLHISFKLRDPVYKRNEKAMDWVRSIKDRLTRFYGGDRRFVNHITKNPFSDKYSSEFKMTDFSLRELETFLRKKGVMSREMRFRRPYMNKPSSDLSILKKVPNGDIRVVTSIAIGTRNVSLFDMLRFRAYALGRSVQHSSLIQEGRYLNSLIDSPLPLNEIDSISNSIYNFMVTRYIPKYVENRDRKVMYRKKLLTEVDRYELSVKELQQKGAEYTHEVRKNKTKEIIDKFIEAKLRSGVPPEKITVAYLVKSRIEIGKTTLYRYKDYILEAIERLHEPIKEKREKILSATYQDVLVKYNRNKYYSYSKLNKSFERTQIKQIEHRIRIISEISAKYRNKNISNIAIEIGEGKTDVKAFLKRVQAIGFKYYGSISFAESSLALNLKLFGSSKDLPKLRQYFEFKEGIEEPSEELEKEIRVLRTIEYESKNQERKFFESPTLKNYLEEKLILSKLFLRRFYSSSIRKDKPIRRSKAFKNISVNLEST